MSAPTLMPDAITPAFQEMLVCSDTAAQMAELVYHSTSRHRLLGGKSARLLRHGDHVAVCDLHSDRHALPGIATVDDVHITGDDIAFVFTMDHGLFYMPASRLVLTCREG